MSDYSFTFSKVKGYADMQIANGDFLLGDDLETSATISLFSDRRATDSEFRRFAGEGEKPSLNRGWWCDTFLESTMGSGLWLITREKRTNETLATCENYVNEALRYLISDGVARTVNTEATFNDDILEFTVSIAREDNETSLMTFAFAWDQLRGIQVIV